MGLVISHSELLRRVFGEKDGEIEALFSSLLALSSQFN
jgi:hypothetical protein